jgi:hypothetical protein
VDEEGDGDDHDKEEGGQQSASWGRSTCVWPWAWPWTTSHEGPAWRLHCGVGVARGKEVGWVF